MRLVLDSTDRIVAISKIAEPIAHGVKIGSSTMYGELYVKEVDSVPDEVQPYKYFYRNGTFCADPTVIDANAFYVMQTAIKKLNTQINSKPVEEMTLEEYKSYKRDENNKLLAAYLKNNPIKWTNGKRYGITMEDQQELSGNIMGWTLASQSGQTVSSVKWHAVGEECEEWDPTELCRLAVYIQAIVVPIVALCQRYKTKIIAAKTKEELELIELKYTPELITELHNGGTI